MKNFATIILLVTILFACNKKQVDSISLPSPVAEKLMDCKFATNPLQEKRISSDRGANYIVTATALSTNFLNEATVKLKFKVKGKPIVITRRVEGESTVTPIGSCQNCGEWIDNTAIGNTRYVYTVNGTSASVTTLPVPIVSGNGITPVIFLNFEGGFVSGANWGGVDRIMENSGMEQWEKDSTVHAWEIVRDKYGFNVIITTDREVYNATHYSKRQEIIYTQSDEWYGNVGGVAIVPSMGYERPAFVFTRLLSYNVSNIIFAGIHEAGHTLGLYHAVDSCGQAYGAGNYWMGGRYGVPIADRTFSASQLNAYCNIVNEILTVKSYLQ